MYGNRKYSLEFWAKAESGGDGGGSTEIRYAVFDAYNNAYLGADGSWKFTNSTEEAETIISRSLTTNYARKVQDFATLGGAVIQLRFYTPASGAVYLDDVAVTEINDFTMSAWIKAGAGQQNDSSLFYQMGREFSNEQGYSWFFDTNNLLTMKFYSTGEDGSSVQRAPTANLIDSNWHMVAFSATRTGNYSIYRDGVLLSQGTFAIGRMNNSEPLMIGAKDGLGSNGFRGQIDEVRFYKRALSPQEALNHFRGMYQDKCSIDLAVTYNLSAVTGSISSAYNADLRLKRQLPDSILSMPFDINAGSDELGGITDYSRLLQHATKTGAAWTASGKYGGAYQFTAATDKITAPSSVLSGTGDFTMAAWINPKSPGGKQWVMGNKVTEGAATGAYLAMDGNVLELKVGQNTVASAATVSPDVWSHVAAIRQSGQAKLYLNGVLVATGDASGDTTGAKFTIGNSPDSSSHFTGAIDEVNVFSRALSDSELASLYNETVTVSSRPLITSQN